MQRASIIGSKLPQWALNDQAENYVSAVPLDCHADRLRDSGNTLESRQFLLCRWFLTDTHISRKTKFTKPRQAEDHDRAVSRDCSFW